MFADDPTLDRTWIEDGLCYKEKGRGTPEAVNVYFKVHRADDILCRNCPVQKDCLAYARAAGVKFGVWGGVRFNGDQGEQHVGEH